MSCPKVTKIPVVKEKITDIAITDGTTMYTLPIGCNHGQIAHQMPEVSWRELGFRTNYGRFVGRKEAATIAANARQIKMEMRDTDWNLLVARGLDSFYLWDNKGPQDDS